MFVKNFYKLLLFSCLGQKPATKSAGYSIIDKSGAERLLGANPSTNTVKILSKPGQDQYAASVCRAMTDNLTKNYITSAPNATTGSGVVFGNGTTPVSFDDYALSGDILSTLSVSNTSELSSDADGMYATSVFTVTNTGSETFTISEVALYGFTSAYVSSTSSSTNIYPVMVERTLLDEPVTIPAGGVGIVTYKIDINYPTA